MQETHSRTVQTSSESHEVEPTAAQTVAKMEMEQRRFLLKISQFIWLLVGILEGTILLRIVLKLIGANPNNAFTQLVYAFTAPFLAPFAGIQSSPSAEGLVLEIPAIVALLVYALISVVIERAIWILFSRPKV